MLSQIPEIVMRLLPALVALPLFAAPALANDSTAELRAGGLVLTRTDAIEMDEEDLYVSPAEIRVRYRFLNRGAAAVTTRIAFPMPDIAVDGPDENISVPTQSADNLLDFSTRANGRPVTAEVEQKVFARGVEQTDVLRRLGVPLAPHLLTANEALDRLPAAAREDLLKRGLAEIDEYDVGKGMEKHLAPRWRLQTTWHWEQTFAPGETLVEHRYKPSVGASVGTMVGSPEWPRLDDARDYEKRFCMDRDFLSSAGRLRAGAQGSLRESRIAYVLTTGANWAKPIRAFRLVVDKEAPGALVSFCGEGVRKIGPTQFEMRKENFTPTRDLDVLILWRLRD